MEVRLSGRDTAAVNKTLNGLLKLMQPNPEVPLSERASGIGG
jgi:ATP-dependent Lon protease